MTLTFDMLRRANLARLPLFKNSKGEPAHSEPDGSDWSLGEWCTAVLGELGEAANIIKKIKRGDISLDEARTALAKEFADATVYLDILAYQADIDLGAAVWAKWDEVSERIEIDLRIAQFKSHQRWTQALGGAMTDRFKKDRDDFILPPGDYDYYETPQPAPPSDPLGPRSAERHDSVYGLPYSNVCQRFYLVNLSDEGSLRRSC